MFDFFIRWGNCLANRYNEGIDGAKLIKKIISECDY